MEQIIKKFNLKKESRCCPFFYKVQNLSDWEILKKWIIDNDPKLQSMRFITKDDYSIVKNICQNLSLKEPKITDIDNINTIKVTEDTMNQVVLTQVWTHKNSKTNLLIEINIEDL